MAALHALLSCLSCLQPESHSLEKPNAISAATTSSIPDPLAGCFEPMLSQNVFNLLIVMSQGHYRCKLLTELIKTFRPGKPGGKVVTCSSIVNWDRLNGLFEGTERTWLRYRLYNRLLSMSLVYKRLLHSLMRQNASNP